MLTILLLLIIASPFILFKCRNTQQGHALITYFVISLLLSNYKK